MSMREQFGSWGRTLNDTEFALALLGLGLIPVHLRSSHSVAEQEGGLRSLLAQGPGTLLQWSLDALPTEASRWAVRHSPASLAAIMGSAPPRDRRVALLFTSAVDALSFWTFLSAQFLLVPPNASYWSAFVSMPAPPTVTRFRWPVRVGYFRSPASEPIAMELQARDEWGGDVYGILSLDRRHSECDVLVWEGQTITEAIEALSAASFREGGVVADLLFLCLAQPIPQDLRCRDLLPLYRAAEASGVFLVSTSAVPGAWILKGALVELSHNYPLDLALARASSGNGVLIAEESLIAKSRISSRIQAVARMLQRPEQAARPIEFDSDTTGFLGLPKQRMRRAEAGKQIEKVASDYQYVSEGAQASAVGRTTRQLEKEDEALSAPRYLQAGFCSPGEQAPRDLRPLEEERPYEVLVFVGEQDPRYLVTDQPIPPLEPLDDGRAHRLTVVFWEPRVAKTPQLQHIDLPAVGSSEACRFPVRTPAGATVLQARITLMHRNRVLQTGILTAPVGNSGGEYSFRLDAVPRAVLSGLDERLKFNAAIVVNDIAGESQIHVTGGEHASVLKWDNQDVQGLIQVLGAAIGQITERPKDFEGLRATGSVALLCRLAQKGASLREYLLREVVGGRNLVAASHVQLVMANATKVLPIEFLYDFDAPERNADLCPMAEAGLEYALNDLLVDGKCPTNCPTVAAFPGAPVVAEKALVCPLAFWGVRCVIERRAHKPDEGALGGDAKFVPEPIRAADRILHPTARTVIGATTRANPPSDPNATENMIDRIKKVVPECRIVHSWGEWESAVAEANPSLLTLIVHQEPDEFGTPELEIGQPPNLNSDLVRESHVPQTTHPVVLLIGCETALAGISYENFALRFHWRGAVVVVSTTAKILGRQAAPLAAEIVEELARVTGPRPFGEVLRNVRCRLMLKGTPMVLALTALGDADWDVVGAG